MKNYNYKGVFSQIMCNTNRQPLIFYYCFLILILFEY